MFENENKEFNEHLVAINRVAKVVKGGKNMIGQQLIIPMENKQINVTVTDPVFFDKENKRLNA